jgi:hypothetical protein
MNKTLKDFKWDMDPNGRAVNNPSNIEKVKDLLDSKGCGFCLAKFKQVTMHLGTGMTHSCHHPVPHKIPLDEIKANPAALFNTQHLKTARKQMLNNEKPAECDYCWRVEDNNGNSDRYFKSIAPWALEDHDNVVKLTGDEDIYPSYLEVSFGNICNLKCTYCGPEFSSKWVEDIKQHGPLKVLENTSDEQWVQGWQDMESLNFKTREFNPYLDAFWKWFPEAYKHLYEYRITGGEPLLSKETYKTIDWLINNPNPNLEFSINSNFNVPEDLWIKFKEKIALVASGNKVKRVTIFTSVEGWDEQAAYGRTGLDFDLFKRRYEEIVSLGIVRCVIMATYNIFSITTFSKLLAWHLELKKKYNPNKQSRIVEQNTGYILDINPYSERKEIANFEGNVTVSIDIPYLRHPTFLDVQIVTHDLVEKFMIPDLTFMAKNVAHPEWTMHQGFESYEIDKFKRIIMHRMHYIKKNNSTREEDINIVLQRAKFYDFVVEIDKRRGTSFLETFPEMENFWNVCEEAKNTYLNSLPPKES